MTELNRRKIDPFVAVDAVRQVAALTLSSADMREGEPLPTAVYDAASGGEDRSPQLSWSGAPAGTKSYVVTCYDPDAPTGAGFWHWAVANIPASVTSLETGAGNPSRGLLPAGAITMPNEARVPAFIGAGPPEGTGVHHYWFNVFALDVESIDIDPQATPAVLGFMMRNAVLARASLVATGEYAPSR